jgi:hypothetical protein
MICLAKPGVTEDLYVMQKEEFSITCYVCRPGIFISDQHIPSERVLHKDYECKGSVARKEKSGREHQEAWHQAELIGGKLPVVK